MNTIEKLNGQDVHIILRHVVYGDQELCVKNFQLIQTKERIGFKKDNRLIYCTKENAEYKITESEIRIKDKMLSIIISKM